MPDENQQNPNRAIFDKLVDTLSGDRIGAYLKASGHDTVRALDLYLWNAKIGEAFHLPIQSVEVALRNRINVSLEDLYGNKWWQNDVFKHEIVDDNRRLDIETVMKRIRNRNLPLVNGQVVAGLSFGFWVGMLQARYNPPIWGSHLQISFPDLPAGKTRKVLAKRAGEVASIRNRISHHEPIFKRDLSKDFKELMEFLSWVCPTKAQWIRPHCRISEILRQKP